MTTVLAYLRLTLFLAGVLVGVQIPGFVDQYGKSLEAHFLESQKALAEFQRDADRYFEGDIGKLVYHYDQQGDPVFRAGGRSIDSIYRRNRELGKAVSAFGKGLFSAHLQTFLTPIPDIREEVWNNYTFIIKLDLPAISTGLLAGLMLAVLVEFVVRGGIGAAALLHRNRQLLFRSD